MIAQLSFVGDILSMSKRPLCFDEPQPFAFKKARVARFLLVPAPRRVLDGSQLTESELSALQEYGSLLPFLTAANAKRREVTDAFVDVLSAAAPHLRAVSLSGNAALTDSSLMLLGFRCREVTALELQGCPGITSQGLELVLTSSRASLEILDVRGCPLIGDAVVAPLAVCSNLRELSVAGTSISGTGLQSILAGCHKLEALDVSGLALASADVHNLAGSLPLLRLLDVSFCASLLPKDVQQIFDTDPAITLKAFGVDLLGVRVPSTATLVY